MAKKETKSAKKTKTSAQVKKSASAKVKPTESKLTVEKAKKTSSSRKNSQTKSKPAVIKEESISVTTIEDLTQPHTLRVKKPRFGYIIAAVCIIIIGILLFIYRGLFVAVVVNGQPISRLSVIQETEKESGKQALATIVRNTLIQQEASKENVTVSDQEVNTQLNTVKANLARQGENINDVLATQGMTMTDLTQLLRLDLLVQKMVGKQVVIPSKDISNYIAKNQDTLPQNESQAQLQATVKQQLQQQELNQKTQTWLQSLQSNAKIIYFVQY